MDIKTLFSILSGLLVIGGFIFYLIDCLRGKTKPRKATWIIFFTLDGIAFCGMLVEWKLNGQIATSVVVAALSLWLAFRNGTPGWTLRDKMCLCGAVLALTFWWYSGNPTVGVVISMTVLVFGAVPMVVETWFDPRSEDRVAWLFYWLSCIAMLLGIREWTLTEASQPIAFTIVESTMTAITWFRPPKVIRD